MAHIHTGAGEHDLTASAFIVRTDFDEPKLMLHRHRKLGKYLQFGGHVELNENPWQAVTHEIQEESGYELKQLQVLQPSQRIVVHTEGSVFHPQPLCVNTHVFNDEHKHIDITWVFVADQPPAQSVAEAESEEFLLVSKSELAAMLPEQLGSGTREIGAFIFDVAMISWDSVAADSVR